ncbi:MAG TPA: AsmA family protein, partial [Saprospiraceae bacterium]|nr:AsmA family protein [Saprospiraceae bacterium]
MKTILRKSAKITGIAIGGILLLLFLLPILFPNTVAGPIKKWTNQSIEGELNFSKIQLSFFRHFPSLTLTLYDFSLTGSEPFAKDTLIAGKAISFGIDVASVFGDSIEVNKFFIEDAFINIQVDEKGNANYNVYKGKESAGSDSSNTRLKIEGIFIKNSRLIYNDRSMPMRIDAIGFNYEGRGDLTNDQFDLQSHLSADRFDFAFDGTTYMQRKNVKADLITGINTSSLEFRFAKNDLLINKLPVDFTGSMAILKEGYDIDLKVISGTTDFGNLFSALPPEYDSWFADTKFSGQSQIRVDMKGSYRAKTSQAPDFSVRLWVHDGMISHKDAPAPLQHFWVNSTLLVPGLNTDSTTIVIDTLKFELDGAPTHATLFVKGIETPYVKANVNSSIDLELLDRALGLTIADLKGQLRLQGSANGYYRSDTVIHSIPTYHMDAGIINGYFKYRDLPMAVEQVNAQIKSDCATGKLQDVGLVIDQFNAAIGNGQVTGDFAVKGLVKSNVKGSMKANLQLEDLAKAIPFEGYTFGGRFIANLHTEGRMDLDKEIMPATNGTLQITN